MTEPCMSCGRDTAPGTSLFSSRKRAIDRETGEEGALCQACQPGSASAGAEQTTPLAGRFAVVDMPGGYPG